MLSPSVTKKRERLKLRPGGRFDPSVIADRLEALRELAEVEPKDVGGAIWPSQTTENAARSWYKRAKQKRTPFSLPEIQAAVDYLAPAAKRLGKIQVTVLPGFPFIDLFVSIAVERGDVPRPGPRRV
jgi:hypothetical protein